MTITLASCTEIDPMLTACYREVQSGFKALDYPPLEILVWIKDFWRQSDKYPPKVGGTWIARNAAGLTVGKCWLNTCPRNLEIMLSAFMVFQMRR